MFNKSLFGNINQQPQQQQQQQQPQQGGGLFGTMNTTNQTQGGLFGNKQGQPGLFGNVNPTPQNQGTMGGFTSFANTNQVTNPGQSTFGNPNPMFTGNQNIQSTSTTSIGLFGNQPNQTTGGSLFGQGGMQSGGMQTGGMQTGGMPTGMFGQQQQQSINSIPSFGSTNVNAGFAQSGTQGMNLNSGSNLFSGGFTNPPVQGSNLFGSTSSTQLGGFNLNQPQSGLNLGGGMQNLSNQQKIGVFGSTTTTGTGMFRQNNPPQTTGSGIFGSNLGQTSGIGFQQQQSKGLFNTPSLQTGGITTGNVFGSSQTTNLGLNTGANYSFGAQNKTMSMVGLTGTHMVQYHPTKVEEQSNTNGQARLEVLTNISITSMPEYSSKSIQELRYEDYINKKNGVVQQRGFVTGGGFTTGGQNITGQIGTIPSFGSSGGNLGFKQPNLLGQNIGQPQPQTGFLGQDQQKLLTSGTGLFTNINASQQSSFGGQSTTSTSSLFKPSGGGLFNQQQTQPTGLGFGQQQVQPQQQAQGFNLLGNVQPQTGFGTLQTNQPQQGGFFQQTNQPQQQGGVFQTTTQPQQGGFFQQTTQPQQQGGLFQTTIQPQKQGGLFQPQQQGGLFPSSTQPQQTSMFQSTTQPQQGGGLFQTTTTQPSLFSKSVVSPGKSGLQLGTTQQSATQPGGGLFQSSSLFAPKPEGTSLFQTTTAPQQTSFGGSSLFSQPQQQPKQDATGFLTQTTGTTPSFTSLFNQKPTTGQPQDQKPQQLGFFQQPSVQQPAPQYFQQYYPQASYPKDNDIKNFIYGGGPEKSLEEILNGYKKEFTEVPRNLPLYNDPDDVLRQKQRDLFTDYSKGYFPLFGPYDYKSSSNIPLDYGYHANILSHRGDYYDSFLKSKRSFQGNKYPSYNINEYIPQEPRPRQLLDFNYIEPKDEEKTSSTKKSRDVDSLFLRKDKSKPLEDEDEFKLKKSHSCDLIKRNEKLVISNLEQSLKNVNIEESISKMKKPTENVMVDLHISLQEPQKINFNLKINKNCKMNVLKTAIVEQLREKNPKIFKKLTNNSFVLMKKYSLLKENATISELEIKDNDIIYVLLKENETDDGSKKEIKSEKKKKKAKPETKQKPELAPIESLPILTNPGYKTSPDFREICRMTLEDLRNVPNFEIYNDWGKLQFEGLTNLEKINLDQIVKIEKKKISVYQNGNDNFAPPIGMGLNKPAILHVYKCFPSDEDKADEEQNDLYLASLQKICKEKGAEFLEHKKNTGEWIFRVQYFVDNK